ncbi:MAG: hypothetical protein Q8R02_06650 [Hyphomonadaceae bacterium]|nr:hypothetical protein [Hyphomonadaceae bacterium]
MHSLPYNGRKPLLLSPAMTQIARFAAVFAAACALAGASFADPYKVKDLVVDKTAPTAAQATREGTNEARLVGAQRLIDRLTLPEDRAASREPLDINLVGTRMYKSSTTQEQFKTFSAAGGARATGVVMWAFDPKLVREYLDARGVPYVDTQDAKALLVPSVASGVDAAQWGAQWTQAPPTGGTARIPKSDDTVLTPYVASVESWSRRPVWMDVQAELSSIGGDHAIVAEAYSQGGGIYVRLVDLRTNAGETGLGLVGPFADLGSAQRGAVAELERAWKTRSIVRTSGSTSLSSTASFRDLGEWVKIRKGLETSRLVRNLNVESISAGGADVSFVYSGRPDQLTSDLRSRGVDLRGADGGWMLQVVAAQ